MRGWEYALTGGLIAVQLAFELGFIQVEARPHIEGPWPGDELLRDLVRVDGLEAQRKLDEASDYTWHVVETFPFYGSALVGALLIHGDVDVAWQLTAISAQSLFLTGVLSRLAQATVRRQRPHFRALCPPRDEELEEFCRNRPGESVSFFSGHAAMAFVGAGLTCRFHEELPLFGGGWGDALACAGAVGGAAATGLLRGMSDRHYASDLVIGSLLGFFNGYFLPKLLHFEDRPSSKGEGSGAGVQWLPWLGSRDIGLSVMGRLD